MAEITVGAIGEARVTVTSENTALTMGSGSLEVFATPAMCALMEKAAVEAVAPFLDEGATTVGIALSISHDAATALGKEVVARAEVIAVDGRKISYRVQAFEGETSIGKGTHDRFIVDAEKFMGKLKK